MSTKMSSMASPGELPSSPAQADRSKDYPVSPILRQLWKNQSPKTSGSYGCQREVYHPLSPLAESSAILHYNSDEDDEDDEDDEAGVTASLSKLNVTEAVDESSPLAHRGNAANLPIARNGNRSRFAPKAGPSYRRASSETLEPVQRANFPTNRKRTSQANISDVFGIESKSLHISQTTEEERPKRYKNDGSPSRKLSYGSSSDSDDVATPGTPDTKGKGVASPGSPESSAKKLQESPKIVSGTPTCPRRSSAKTPSSALPTKSPRQFPLPDSPEGSPVSSPESSPIISLQPSPMRPVNLSPFNQKKSHASITAAAASARFGIFEIKSHHYTEAVTRPTIDRKLAQGLESIYTNVNRFDPKEAAELEEEYQRKIRIIYDRQVAKEQRQIEKERLEKEKIRLAEEKRKLEEDQKQREEEERLRKEQEEIERKKREEEEKKAKAEQDKKDAEARRIAEEKAKAEKEAREKAEQQQAAAAAANAAQQKAQAAQAQAQAQQAQAQAQQAQSAQQATPEVYGRMSMATKAAAVRRIIKNLKELEKLDETFIKNSGLNAIRRELMPKFGQLTGQKDQTIQVREAIKIGLQKVLAIPNAPPVPISDYLLIPPAQDVQVPVTMVWMTNQIAKMAFRQIKTECIAKPELADCIGVVIAAVFADSKYCLNGISLIDIVVARFLKWSPLLLGETGPDATVEDKKRLGFKVDEDDGTCETNEVYATRMQALAAGYVALAARDFRKSKMTNPHPAFNLWSSMAYIMNIPTEKLTNYHFYIMSTIIGSGGAKKLCEIYGSQARKLIECAIGPWAEIGLQKDMDGASRLVLWRKELPNCEWWNKVPR